MPAVHFNDAAPATPDLFVGATCCGFFHRMFMQTRSIASVTCKSCLSIARKPVPDQNNAVETCLRNLKNAFNLQPSQMPEARKIVLQFYVDLKNK